jgi:glutamate-1-semialdehyde 2,1-aminomutase
VSELAGGVNYNFRLPGHEPDLVVDNAAGSLLTTSDGRRLIDLFAAFGARAFPHGCVPYQRAVEAGTVVVSGSLPSVAITRAARAVLGLFPHHTSIRFGTSGTEATQLAIRIARAATGRSRVLRFDGHYHGHLDALLGGTYSAATFPEPAVLPGDPRATEGGSPQQLQSQNYLARWNNVNDLAAVFAGYSNHIAAVLLEPYPINAGGIAPAPGFLELLRRYCDQHQVILIFDEVITGFRAGLGGWQAVAGVTPDITLLGKMLGGGAVPVSAVLAAQDLLELCADHRVVHGGTFNGSPLAAAAITGTMDLLTTPGPLSLDALQDAGRTLVTAIRDHVGRVGLPLTVTGLPGGFWIHPAPEQSGDLRHHLLQAGVLPAMPTRFYPTAGMTADELEASATHIINALDAYAALAESPARGEE